MKTITVGVDVGGTNVKLGLIDVQGHVLARSRLDTKSYVSDTKKLIHALGQAIMSLLDQSKFSAKNIRGIGVGLPGLVDPLRGVVIFLPNIPGWKNVPLRKLLEKDLALPVFLENDVNMIALGEWKFGAGCGAQDMVVMTLGTGVGAGLILSGELYRGPGFAAGELGHVPLNMTGPRCNCPSYACLEAYVGNQRLEARAAKIFKRKQISLEEIFALAKSGDQRAIDFWQEAGRYIGAALVGVVNVLNPQRIVIGGGVSHSARFLFPAIRREIQDRAMPVQAKMAKVAKARLGDDAGLIGAQVLVQRAMILKSRA